MDTPEVKKLIAWQPLTPRGIARFASARLGQLLLVQFVFALLAASIAVWFVARSWFPAIDEAVSHLPEQGDIRSGKLNWPGDSPMVLSERGFLSFSVDLEHLGTARSPADLQVEFGRTDVRIASLFGFVRLAYPPNQSIAFSRGELVPWWGAWKPPLLGMTAGAVLVGLMVTWAVLATLYCGVVWLVGTLSDREMSLRQCWRLAGAALMPGALLQLVALVAYGLGIIHPLELCLAAAAHFVLGWVYLLISPVCLPKAASGTNLSPNPFSGAPAQVNPNPSAPPPEAGVKAQEPTEAPRTNSHP